MTDTQARPVEALLVTWRQEAADYQRLAADQAPMGGHLYTRYLAKWELAQRYADALDAALRVCQPSDGARCS